MEVHVSLAAETLFHVGPVPITNSMLTMFIVMALILLVGAVLARRAQPIPGRAQGAFEGIVEFLLNLVEGTAGKRAGRRIFPLVGGIFIFIIVANYSGLLPGVGTVGFYEGEEPGHEEAVLVAAAQEDEEHAAEEGEAATGAEQAEGEQVEVPTAGAEEADHEDEGEHTVLVPFFRAPNADLNMTLALAVLTFAIVQVAGIAAHGVGGRIKHMADPPFLFPIEVISEF